MDRNFFDLFYKKRLLINVLIELTNVCNMRCVHCYQADRSNSSENIEFLQYSAIEKMLHELEGSSDINITLTGGEIFTHPDIEKIILAIKKRNFNVNLLTNCTLINEENISLIKHNVNHISASCYGKSAESYECVTRVKGSFETYNNAINLLKKYNVRYNEKAVVLKNNYSNIDNLINQTTSADCRLIVDRNNPYCSNLSLNEIQLKEFLHSYYLTNNRELQMFNHRKAPLVCKMWYNSLFISRFGEISPCLNLYDKNFIFGNIHIDNILDVWNSKASIEKVQDLSNKIKNSSCFSCEYGKYEQICPANNFYETGNIMTPSKFECDYCRAKNEVISSMIKRSK